MRRTHNLTHNSMGRTHNLIPFTLSMTQIKINLSESAGQWMHQETPHSRSGEKRRELFWRGFLFENYKTIFKQLNWCCNESEKVYQSVASKCYSPSKNHNSNNFFLDCNLEKTSNKSINDENFYCYLSPLR